MFGTASSTPSWRSDPGTYLLVLEAAAPLVLEIGRLGRHTFPAGLYAYAGSALGPGGVAARLTRHLRADKATHWHIDYLAAAAPVIAAGAAYAGKRLECDWARSLGALEGATAPAPGFGSSDCRSGCASHLWRLPDTITFWWIEDELTRCPIQAI